MGSMSFTNPKISSNGSNNLICAKLKKDKLSQDNDLLKILKMS